jgi:AmmeMemoRadiSam system protein B
MATENVYTSRSSVRPPICADDQWYPSRPEPLRQLVDRLLDEAPRVSLDGELIGLVSPHAGYRFSGHVAAAAYRAARDNRPYDYETVVLIGPVHRMYTEGFVTSSRSAWATPLGEVPLDREVIDALSKVVSLQRLAHDNEHSLEVQLPFLQRALGDFALVPIMMGDQSLQSCYLLGDAIAQAVKGKKALLVASTDLSHYYDYETAKRLDQHVLDFVQAYDEEGLARALNAREAEACGGGPVVTVMWAARALGANKAHIVKYANSGDVWPDRSAVVGYAAVAITRPH